MNSKPDHRSENEATTQRGAGVDLQRLVRRFRYWRRKRRCESRIKRNVCPLCNSDAPECDRCQVCQGSREYPLSAATQNQYRERFWAIDWILGADIQVTRSPKPFTDYTQHPDADGGGSST